MKNQQDLMNCISNNPELMTILTIVEELHLPQSCLCAGTIRSTIWNHLSTKKITYPMILISFFLIQTYPMNPLF